MKKLLLITLIGLFLVSCKENSPEHFTIYIPVDSLIFNEATYIKQGTSVVQVNKVTANDIFICPAYSKLVFTKQNVSVRYLGGWRDTLFPMIAAALLPIYPEDAIFDTIYVTRGVYTNYAILEVAKDGNVSIDTAVQYHYNYFKFLHEDVCPNPYNSDKACIFDVELYSDLINKEIARWRGYGTNIIHPFYRLPMDGNVYLLDQYPYWKNPMDSTYLTFYAY